MKKIVLFLSVSLIVLPLANSQVLSRLVGHTYAANNGQGLEPQDSTRFIYNTGLQGIYIGNNAEEYGDVFNNIERQAGQYMYNTALFFTYSDSNNSYNLAQQHSQVMDNAGNIHSNTDTILIPYTNNQIVQWKDSFEHNANNNIILRLHMEDPWGTGLENDTRILYAYDNNNNLILATQEYWFNGVWNNAQRVHYTYNTGNQLIKMRIEEWYYTYWRDVVKKTYSYDNSNRLATMHTKELMYIGNIVDSFTINYRNVYNYNLADDVISDVMETGDSTSTIWTYDQQELHTYDGDHNRLSTILQGTNNANIYKYDWTYNTFNQPLTKSKQVWNVNTWIDDEYYRYYYEEVPTAINEQLAGTDGLKVYPSPANNFIQMELNLESLQLFTAAIYDMQGRLIRQWTEKPAAKMHISTIPVAGMASGNYILKLNTAGQQLSAQFSITN